MLSVAPHSPELGSLAEEMALAAATSATSLVEDFDSTPANALPAGWTQYTAGPAPGFNVQNLAITGRTPPTAPNGIGFSSSGSGDKGWLSPAGSFSGDVQVTLDVRPNWAPLGVFARGTGHRGSDPTFYALEVHGGGPVLSLVKYINGIRSEITTVPNGAPYVASDSDWFTLTLQVTGTSVKGMLYRPSTGKYLASNSTWTDVPTWAINENDLSIPAGTGVGIIRDVSTVAPVFGDDFTASDLMGDFANPVVSITSPSPGTTFSGASAVTVSASDNTAIDRVEYFVGTERVGIERDAPYTFQFDSSRFQDGPYELKARAYDTSNNWSESSVAVSTSNDLSTPPPALVPKLHHIQVGGFVSTNTNPDSPAGMDALIRDQWGWVESDPLLISAIDSWSPGVDQVIYSNTTNIYTSLLLDWNKWADDRGVDRERAFYHLLVPAAGGAGAGGSSWQSARFWNVRRVASGVGANFLGASYDTLPADIALGTTIGDTLDIGYPEMFREVRFSLSSAAANGWIGQLEYCTATDAMGNPIAWSALPLLSDDTHGFTVPGSNLRALFEPPADWVPCHMSGGLGGSSTYGYYVRVRTASGGTAPVASQILSYDFSGIGANGTGISSYPAFDRNADTNTDGYLNAVEYANRAAGKDAYFRYQARADFSYGDWRPSTNPGDAFFRQWAVDYHARLLAANPGLDGFFMDNVAVQRFGRIGSTAIEESIDRYPDDYGSLSAAIWHDVGWIAGNISGVSTTTAADWLHWNPAYTSEGAIRAWRHTRSDFDATRQAIVDYEAAGAIFGLIDSRDEPSIPLEADGYQNRRLQLSTLAYYYLIAAPHTFFGVFNDTSTTNSKENSIQAIPFNVGVPVDADPSTWLPGADANVVKRQYSNALVLWKPMASTNPPNSAKDDPATAATYNLGGVFRAVQYDGTLGVETSTITLRNGEGAILIPAAASPTTTNLTASPNSSAFGSSVTLFAAVTPAPMTGTVTFMDGTLNLGTAMIFGGSATLTVSGLGVGNHSLTAVYSGNSMFLGSASSPIAHTVSPRNGTSIPAGGRKLFYNNSLYDGNNAAVDANDNLAIATDKSPYIPGSGAATYANVSSYTKGINGIMIDLAGPHGPLSLADFAFTIGNNNLPGTWSAAPAPATVSTRVGAGIGGSDRIVIIWNDGEIGNSAWLRVIVKGNDALGGNNLNSGLIASDEFYWGIAVGDTGFGNGTRFTTTTTDELSVRNNSRSRYSSVPVTNVNDLNRDGAVNATDQLSVRNNSTSIGNGTVILNVGAAALSILQEFQVTFSRVTAGLSRHAMVTEAATRLRMHMPWLPVRLHSSDLSYGSVAPYLSHLDTDSRISQKLLRRVDSTVEDAWAEDMFLDFRLDFS